MNDYKTEFQVAVVAVAVMVVILVLGAFGSNSAIEASRIATERSDSIARAEVARAVTLQEEVDRHRVADSIAEAALADSTVARAARALVSAREQGAARRRAENRAVALEATLDSVQAIDFDAYKAERDTELQGVKADLEDMTADRNEWQSLALGRKTIMDQQAESLEAALAGAAEYERSIEIRDAVIDAQASTNQTLKLVGGVVVLLSGARELGLIGSR